MSTMDAYKEELARFLQGFGANVRRLRSEMNPRCSQERLSHATRLHRTEIGKIEQGEVEPRLSTLLILADGLGVSVQELLSGLWVPVERRPSPHAGRWDGPES
ncbi:MAG TPA: helix-turn-helix transcriptional regulator [Solirubrobacteraceae bacterium]|nr:helix-turn-helix transcriptional regulator [Solirubrobacteraceae bacterium]